MADNLALKQEKARERGGGPPSSWSTIVLKRIDGTSWGYQAPPLTQEASTPNISIAETQAPGRTPAEERARAE